jgi:hypothetical protein
MVNRKHCILSMVCAVALVLVALAPSNAVAFGCDSCAAPVVAAPAYSTYYAPAYTSYYAPAYTSYYAPATYAYMPTSVYRAVYRPAVVTAYQPAYQPAVAYTTAYTGYAYTTYRPWLGWGYRTRIVPYTAYSPVYSALPVVASPTCSTCASYSPCDSCSPCAGGSCGMATYSQPTSGCSSCSAQATYVAPVPNNNEPAPATNAAPQDTFQKSSKPVVEPENKTDLKPIPQTETRSSSTPLPLLPNPKDRTAERASYTTARTVSVALPIATVPALSNDGWQPARN